MGTSVPPVDVVVAALGSKPPEHPEGRIRAQAELVVAALIEYGHLPHAHPEPVRPADAARWLAEQSRFPRYLIIGGWKRILESEADVNVAAAKALTYAGSEADRQAVTEAKMVLLNWHAAGRPE